jgi:hypothetical protein
MNTPKRVLVFVFLIFLLGWLFTLEEERDTPFENLSSEELIRQHYEVSTFHFANEHEIKTFATVTLAQNGPRFLYKKVGTKWQRIIFPVERIGGKILSVGYEYPSEFIWVEIGKVTKNRLRTKLYIYSITEDEIEETPAVFTMD